MSHPTPAITIHHPPSPMCGRQNASTTTSHIIFISIYTLCTNIAGPTRVGGEHSHPPENKYIERRKSVGWCVRRNQLPENDAIRWHIKFTLRSLPGPKPLSRFMYTSRAESRVWWCGIYNRMNKKRKNRPQIWNKRFRYGALHCMGWIRAMSVGAGWMMHHSKSISKQRTTMTVCLSTTHHCAIVPCQILCRYMAPTLLPFS